VPPFIAEAPARVNAPALPLAAADPSAGTASMAQPGAAIVVRRRDASIEAARDIEKQLRASIMPGDTRTGAHLQGSKTFALAHGPIGLGLASRASPILAEKPLSEASQLLNPVGEGQMR
jgi:hypothetical protein